MSIKRAQRTDYSSLSVAERKRKLEQLYVTYPKSKEILAQFAHCHQHAKIAAEPEGLLLEGIAGIGKTTLLRHYMQNFPKKLTKEGTVLKVLSTRVQVPASPNHTAISLPISTPSCA